mmetsp:Transcript_16384/g.38805  ORF Transcript_16384/g.38805 Transcript_16384/m.38805 type:complete len:309 (+) Transcript_16384:79-1005(+)
MRWAPILSRTSTLLGRHSAGHKPSPGFSAFHVPARSNSRSSQVLDEVQTHMKQARERSQGEKMKDWRLKDPQSGDRRSNVDSVPYRFRLTSNIQGSKKDEDNYEDFAGLRFPTLETAENIDYHKDRGLNQIVERAFPIKVPGYRRLDPYLREYIFFLHNLDPARFSVGRIAQRYRMREKTVAKVVQEWGTNRYLTRTGLTKLKDKQQTREAVVLAKKEQQYAKWVGWDQLGDEDDSETDDEAIGDTKGWRSTSDWVRRQTVEVEMMSAFPMMEKRDPVPKRVDVDMVVDSRQNYKIINWIDPTDKVVF